MELISYNDKKPFRQRPSSLLRTLLACTALAVFFGVFAATAGATQIYVSPSGSDSNPGTKALPIKTLPKAQTLARAATSSKMTSDVEVILAGGTYNLSAPLALSNAGNDSGLNGHEIIWRAEGYGTESPAKPVISGGETITGWTLFDAKKNIWKASVGSLDTRQLYVNGVRAYRDSTGTTIPGTVTVTETGYTTTSTAPQSWENPSDIEFYYRGSFERGSWAFIEARCGVKSITGNASSSTITMQPKCFALGQALFSFSSEEGVPSELGPPEEVQNSRSFLTKPGTFYLDRTSPTNRTLYYIPRAGENMSTATVVAPKLQELVTLTGTEAHPIHCVEFKGLTFSYATWLGANDPEGLVQAWSMYLREAIETQATIPGNVWVHHGENILFERNKFKKLGAQGLEVGQSSSHVDVIGNEFTDISSGGLIEGVISPEYIGMNVDDTVANNWVHDVALENFAAPGIWTELTKESTVEHNQVDHVPYTGILMGPPDNIEKIAEKNSIVANKVFETMRVMDDGGGIYLRGDNGSSYGTGVVIKGNDITSPSRGVFNLGIYTDDSSQWAAIEGNVISGFLGSIGGCSEEGSPIENEKFINNFWDDNVPKWPCELGPPVNVEYSGNTTFKKASFNTECAANPTCAAIRAAAGVTAAYSDVFKP